MASYQITSPTALADELVIIAGVGASSQNNVTGTSTGTIHIIELDNTANELSSLYLKIVDAASATAGTTQEDFRLYVPPGQKVCYTFPGGHVYANGVSLWTTTGPETTNKDNVGNSPLVKLVVTA